MLAWHAIEACFEGSELGPVLRFESVRAVSYLFGSEEVRCESYEALVHRIFLSVAARLHWRRLGHEPMSSICPCDTLARALVCRSTNQDPRHGRLHPAVRTVLFRYGCSGTAWTGIESARRREVLTGEAT